MNELLEKGVIEKILNEYDEINGAVAEKISKKLASALLLNMADGKFDKYGEVLTYNISPALLKLELLSKLDMYFPKYEANLMVIRKNDVKMIYRVKENDKYIYNTELRDCMCYLDGSIVYMEGIKEDKEYSEKLENAKYKLVENVISDIRKDIYCLITKIYVDAKKHKKFIKEANNYRKFLVGRYRINNYDILKRYMERIIKKDGYFEASNHNSEICLNILYGITKYSIRKNIYCKIVSDDYRERVEHVKAYLVDSKQYLDWIKKEYGNLIIDELCKEYGSGILFKEIIDKNDAYFEDVFNTKKYNDAVSIFGKEMIEAVNSLGCKTIDVIIKGDKPLKCSTRFKETFKEYKQGEYYQDILAYNMYKTSGGLQGVGSMFNPRCLGEFEIKFRGKSIYRFTNEKVNVLKELLNPMANRGLKLSRW